MTEKRKLKKKAMEIVKADGKPLLEWYAYSPCPSVSTPLPSVSTIYTLGLGFGSELFIEYVPNKKNLSRSVYRVGRMVFFDLDVAKVFIEIMVNPDLHERIST